MRDFLVDYSNTLNICFNLYSIPFEYFKNPPKRHLISATVGRCEYSIYMVIILYYLSIFYTFTLCIVNIFTVKSDGFLVSMSNAKWSPSRTSKQINQALRVLFTYTPKNSTF